jgi:hypothetical protein
MSQAIDWSKAPADATHAVMYAGQPHWRKKGAVSWQAWTGSWHPVIPSPDVEYVPRPAAEWDGVGLPPVGTVCEIRVPGYDSFCKAKVLFCRDNALVFEWAAEGVARATSYDGVELRPIRTPRQIAVDEIREILALCVTDKDCAEKLYAAGYRKQVQP